VSTETPPTYIDTSRPASDYARAVDELLQLYTRIDMAVPSLPIASVMPFVKYIWGFIKFEFALIGDILLMVPINIVVFIRNIFPGRWSYKCFSSRYLKTVAGWLWMGECTIPFIVLRPLVIILLHWHFRNRLSAMRHQLLLETGFSEDAAKAALAKLDRAMEFWQQRTTAKSVILTWFLPLIGPFTQLWQFFVPAAFVPAPTWGRFAAITSFTYALSILASAFLVKRGLMLGETGRAAYYPGFAPGPGFYVQEKKILSALGLTVREFPLDIAVLAGGFLLTFLTLGNQLEAYEALGMSHVDPQFFFTEMVIIYAIFIPIMIVSWMRRKKLGRA